LPRSPGFLIPASRARSTAERYLVTTERYEEETKKLLGGTFHEIKANIRIINWQGIVKLCKLLRDTTDMEKELRI
jgi:hypothetical protein